MSIYSTAEDEINKIYEKAEKEADKILKEWYEQFKTIDKKQKNLVESGKLKKEAWEAMRQRRMATGTAFHKLQEKLYTIYNKAYEKAVEVTKKAAVDIYLKNYNTSNYGYEKETHASYSNLLTSKEVQRQFNVVGYRGAYGYPNPVYNKHRTYIRSVITGKVTSAAINGVEITEGIRFISDGIKTALLAAAAGLLMLTVTRNESAAKINAAISQEEIGAEFEKTWLATLDTITRETHREADGQTVGVNEPFVVGGYKMMEPGDSSLGAPPSETRNCRCTITIQLINIDRGKYERRAREFNPEYSTQDYGWGQNYTISGNMTYKQWEKLKKANGQME